jgi:pimeloyl-ACP methyl ester carboxylesterase
MIITFISLGVLVQFTFVNAQSDERLPVLLIHGYHSGPEVWTNWVNQLHRDGFDAEAVYFENDDDCGSSKAHAYELNEIIEQFKVMTNSDKINIVAHSKGGLDARWYLANDLFNDDVEKLIMIGTPNHGSPLAIGSLYVPPFIYPLWQDFVCWPVIYDLIPGSDATRAPINDNTLYYTIAGDWSPSPYYYPNFFYPPFDPSCSQSYWLPFERWGNLAISTLDDGIVPLWSAAPNEFVNIGTTNNCHTNLFTSEEYEMVINTLAS